MMYLYVFGGGFIGWLAMTLWQNYRRNPDPAPAPTCAESGQPKDPRGCWNVRCQFSGTCCRSAVPSGVPTPPPAPQAKSRCASECDLICQQPNGHGGCAKRSAPATAVQGALTKAAQDVLAERQRQIDKEGWTPAHDDAHGGGEMASAAAVYALRASGHFESGVPTYWPWDFADYKPKDNRSNLIRAGALVLAEIERLDRMEVKNG